MNAYEMTRILVFQDRIAISSASVLTDDILSKD